MGYSASEVARLLDLSVGQVRAFVRAGFLDPERGPRGALVFSFQDVVLLRTAKGLRDARIAPARIKRVLARLKSQLPSGRPLTGVAIGAEGNKIVVRDGRSRWNPEDGQALFDFEVAELAERAAPLLALKAKAARSTDEAEGESRSADDWYELGCTLEVSAPAEAMSAYRRALALEPSFADAHVNLGRLLHEARELEPALDHYQRALAARPDDATAAFNRAVVLDDLGRADQAIAAYARALELDPALADAHYNLARLYERAGRETAAIRHLKAYRQLTRGR